LPNAVILFPNVKIKVSPPPNINSWNTRIYDVHK
jgi:hypothetical protein